MIRVEILGRLVKENEVKFLPNGTAMIKNTIAVNEGKDKTSFHDITMFGKVAETFAEYTKKGQMVFINDATIRNSSYEKDGEKRYTSDIIAFSFKFC